MRFSKLYLDDVTECQGDLFTLAQDLDMDLCSFSEVYLTSKVREFMDDGSAYYLTMLGEELFSLVDFSAVSKSKNCNRDFSAKWLGEIYSELQWKLGISSKEVVKLFPLEKLLSRYNVLHDLDISVAIDKLCSNKLTVNI